VNKIDLNYEVVQCLVRSRRIPDKRDAAWLQQLALKLAAISDCQGMRVDHEARRDWLLGGGFEPPV
jgi:hypothetical protein